MLLKDKVALVTGAGKGIGKAISLVFAAEGANLIICSRTKSQIEETAEAIRAAGRECLAVVAAVEKEADVTQMVNDGLSRFGKIDILVNNAGISNPKPFLETSMSDWDDALTVNLKGIVVCTRAVLPHMLQRRVGRVINIASAAGVRGLPGSPAYTASKFAVVGLTQALADEIVDKGVRVNVICPGPVKTELFDSSPVKDFLLKNPAALLMMEDVTGAALYLASDLSGGLNSQTICVRKTSRW
ncbi:MAG: family oxidoreductase [Deltaproteobacteria bacterium]|jgi:NAD(P)-dependent dehydrogenase (short-subunit alcohol dehydrogenase family)|nr:family oxidoreductase [Deltaproteobacteria bacterium]